jgi:glucose-6-phosphate dehydrogenase assembly protein OpcA
VIVDDIESTLRELRSAEAAGGAGVRTNILDLIAFCDSKQTADELTEIVAELPYSRPSRAIVALADPGPARLEWDARVFCLERRGADSLQHCSELVVLHTGEGGAALPSLITSLLLPDLPVFLLWRATPDFEGHTIDRMWPLATRVVADSTLQEGTLEALPLLLDRRPVREVTDLSWTKITAWRDAVARCFDTAENARCLRLLQRIEIHHAGSSSAQARLMAGWIMSRIETRIDVALVAEEREDMRSGSLTGVKLTCPSAEFEVERVDEGIGRVRAPGIANHNVALRVPHIRELLAQELEIYERDEIFEEAVRWVPQPVTA